MDYEVVAFCTQVVKSTAAAGGTGAGGESQVSEMLPKAKTECWKDALSQGPWVEALCIGVDAYEYLITLRNAVADAAAIARGIQSTRHPHHCTLTCTHARTYKIVISQPVSLSQVPSSTHTPQNTNPLTCRRYTFRSSGNVMGPWARNTSRDAMVQNSG